MEVVCSQSVFQIMVVLSHNVVKVKDIDKYSSLVTFFHDEYEFRDETGTINVEIDWDVWLSTPKTKVQMLVKLKSHL